MVSPFYAFFMRNKNILTHVVSSILSIVFSFYLTWSIVKTRSK